MWRWLVGAAIAGGGALVMPGGAGREVVAVRARELVSALAEGRPERALVEWTGTMTRRLPAPALKEQWVALTREAGSFERIGDLEVSRLGRYRLVVVGLRFEREEVIARVTFDSENRIAGLYFLPQE